MLKAVSGNVVFIGLSDKNLEMIQAGKPAKLNLKDLGLPEINIFIFTGKDEETMTDMVKEAMDPIMTVIRNENNTKQN